MLSRCMAAVNKADVQVRITDVNGKLVLVDKRKVAAGTSQHKMILPDCINVPIFYIVDANGEIVTTAFQKL